jgi:hypothetical protein
MTEFTIECGIHKGKVRAKTIGEAWRKLTKNKTTGFARLVRFSEATPRGATPWQYIIPEALDKAGGPLYRQRKS